MSNREKKKFENKFNEIFFILKSKGKYIGNENYKFLKNFYNNFVKQDDEPNEEEKHFFYSLVEIIKQNMNETRRVQLDISELDIVFIKNTMNYYMKNKQNINSEEKSFIKEKILHEAVMKKDISIKLKPYEISYLTCLNCEVLNFLQKNNELNSWAYLNKINQQLYYY